MPKIDLTKSIYELTNEFPELVEIMTELGFMGIKNPILRNTVGRKMTILEGSQKMGIPLEEIILKLKEHDYSIKE